MNASYFTTKKHVCSAIIRQEELEGRGNITVGEKMFHFTGSLQSQVASIYRKAEKLSDLGGNHTSLEVTSPEDFYPFKSDKGNYIYIIKAFDGITGKAYLKLGCSKSIHSRIGAYRVGALNLKIELFKVSEILDLFAVEAAFQVHVEKFLVDREIYSYECLNKAITFAKKLTGVKLI